MPEKSSSASLLQKLDKKSETKKWTAPHSSKPFWIKMRSIFQQVRFGLSDEQADWATYGENFAHHLETFGPVLDEEDLVFKNPKKLVAVDALGPGGWIKDIQTDLENPLKIKKGIALTLSDMRTQSEKESDKNEAFFEIVPGNIFDATVWERFNRSLGDDEIDLFICRPYGGIDGLPMVDHPLNVLLYGQFIQDIYNKTAANGLILIQFSSKWQELLAEWVEIMNAEHEGMAKIETDKLAKYVVIKIKKNTQNLPLLSEQQVRSFSQS